MAIYEKQNFKNGEILYAQDLTHIEDGLSIKTTMYTGDMPLNPKEGDTWYQNGILKIYTNGDWELMPTVPKPESSDSGKVLTSSDGTLVWTEKSNLPLKTGQKGNSFRQENTQIEDESYSLGDNASAFGNNTKAPGINAISQGENSNAVGMNSHASGQGTKALGMNSYAGGKGTIASASNQVVIGSYNKEEADKTFIIGNGDENFRSNVCTLDSKGNAWFANDILFGGSNANKAKVSLNEYFTSGAGETLTYVEKIPEPSKRTYNNKKIYLSSNGLNYQQYIPTDEPNIEKISGTFKPLAGAPIEKIGNYLYFLSGNFWQIDLKTNKVQNIHTGYVEAYRTGLEVIDDKKVCFVGHYNRYDTRCGVFDLDIKKFTASGYNDDAIDNITSAKVKNKIYIYGTYRKSFQDFNSIYTFDLDSKSLNPLINIPYTPIGSQAVVSGTDIFVPGGGKDTVLKLDTLTNKVSILDGKLNYAPSYCGVLIDERNIYIFGGIVDGKVVDTIMRYNIDSQVCTTLNTRMDTPRKDFFISERTDEGWYFIGGNDGNSNLGDLNLITLDGQYENIKILDEKSTVLPEQGAIGQILTVSSLDEKGKPIYSCQNIENLLVPAEITKF